jgi:WD40 repeat protein/predicted Ser/Thr protein kinase
MNMGTERTCIECGAPVRGSAGLGLCAACTFQVAMGGRDLSEGAEPVAEVGTGPMRVGDYDILDELGRGGMGVVYRARQRTLGRIVALKVLLSGPFGDQENRRSLLAEAAAAARLQHPNIVGVHEAGVDGAQPFYSMEYVEGSTLAEMVRSAPLPPLRAARYVNGVALAVQYAHEQGVLHRDIKPSNILVDRRDQPRVADFGLAKLLDASGVVTLTGQLVGSPSYMSPEQAMGKPSVVGPTSDVYSMGAVLYELLTGKPPFQAESPHAVIDLVKSSEPVGLRQWNESLPKDLETICLKCLEKDPGRRYATAGELADDLGRYLGGEPILARPVSQVERFGRWARRRPALATVWVLSVLLALGSSLAAIALSRSEHAMREARALAETNATQAKIRLRQSLVYEAQARRRIPEPGRRFEALRAVAEAARIGPGMDLRNEAAAALALRDIRLIRRTPVPAPEGMPLESLRLGDGVTLFLSPPYNAESFPTRLLRLPSTNSVATLVVPAGARLRSVLALATSGRHLTARWTDDTLRIWDIDQQRFVLELGQRPWPGPTPSPARVTDMDVSADSRWAAVGLPGGGVGLHRLADGVEVARATNLPALNYIRFSPDGRHLCVASASRKVATRLILLTVPGLDVVREIPLPQTPYWPVWSPDGTRIASGVDRSEIRVFRVEDGGLDGMVHLGDQVPYMLQFHPNGEMILSATWGLNLRASNWKTGQMEWELTGVEMGLTGISADGGRLYTTDGVDEALDYEWVEPAILRAVAKPTPDAQVFTGTGALDFSADGRWLVAAYDDEVRLKDAVTGLDLAVYQGKTRNDRVSVACHPGREWLYVCSMTNGLGRIRVEALDGGNVRLGTLETVDSEPGYYLRDQSEDGKRLVLISQSKGQVKTYGIDAMGRVERLASWSLAGAYNAAFGPGGRELLVNIDGLSEASRKIPLRVYDSATGTVLHTLAAPISADVDWSASGGVAMTSNGGGESRLWTVNGWKAGPSLPSELQGNATTFALSQDGRMAAIAVGGVMTLVETRTGEKLVALAAPEVRGEINVMRFSPDGERLASLQMDGRMHLWDLAALRRELTAMGLGWNE